MAGRILDLEWRDVEWPKVERGTRVQVMAGNMMFQRGEVIADNDNSIEIRFDSGMVDEIGKRWVNISQ